MASGPTKKATTKKTAAKKTATKSTSAKKATKKAAAKKAAANEPVTPTPAVEKKPVPNTEAPASEATPVKKAAKKATKKAASKKSASKKTAAKKAAGSLSPAVKQAADAPTTTSPAPRSSSVTTVICKVDVGYGNQLYIRGEGNGLNWDQGVLMENTAPDEWRWSSNQVEGELQFKVLLNDDVWHQGDNHVVLAGATISFEPSFD
ncbi:MAG: hypothetical protein E1N59_2304 [Puniceicoccaceae bacterium 5H]|nr:MAG: hypothetical protein E1N59_2304 [Puniceicoccaceae bacterium 5H]